jgi:hypothetical protein
VIIYPEVNYQPWQFKQDKVPQSYWTNGENRVDALKHLFEIEIQWNIEDVNEKLSWKVLEDNGLGTLHSYYPSLFKIFKAVYQIDIGPWEIINRKFLMVHVTTEIVRFTTNPCKVPVKAPKIIVKCICIQ